MLLVCYRRMMGSETALKHINFLGICPGWATPSKWMGHHVGFWGACNRSLVPVLSPTARCPPPPPPPPPTHPPFPSLPCLSARPTCVNPSQAARRGGVSTAGGLWLPRPDYIGASGGASRPVALSVLCAADWADTRRAGERAEMAQPGTLGPPPRDLAGKTATVAVVAVAAAAAAAPNAGKTHRFHTWFTGFTSAVESCSHLKLKTSDGRDMSFGEGVWNKRIWIWGERLRAFAGCSPPLASNRPFPSNPD